MANSAEDANANEVVLRENARLRRVVTGAKAAPAGKKPKAKYSQGVLTLYADQVVFEPTPSDSGRDANVVIPLRQVLGCEVTSNSNNSGNNRDQEVELRIHAYSVREHLLAEYTLVDFVITFEARGTSAYSAWQEEIRKASSSHFAMNVPRSERLDRRKKLLVLVNPNSGKGKATKIVDTVIRPILTRAGLDFDLVTTKRSKHAQDLVASEDLRRWAGIVIVSGDGLLYEVFQGLFKRDDWERSQSIPIAIIPAGSGNGLARTLVHEAGQKYEAGGVLPSTLNLVAARTRPMDLIRVRTASGKTFYSFLSIGWGFMADVDIESERLRFMGEPRFTLWSFLRITNLRTYPGKLSYKPAAPKRELAGSADSLTDGGTGDSDEPDFRRQLTEESWSEWTDNLKYEASDDKPVRSSDSALPTLAEPVPSDWMVIDDRFVEVYAVNAAYIGTDLKIAPEATVDDGLIWLMIVRRNVTRTAFLRSLLALESGEHVSIRGIDFVPVTAFRLEPRDDGHKGNITIDGELIKYEPIQAEILPSAARIISTKPPTAIAANKLKH